MADKEKPTKKKARKLNPRIVATAYLAFAVHQAFVGWLILDNFANYFAVVAGALSLLLAGIVVLVQFYKR